MRYAFSVIWELNGDAEIQNVKFCKSLIHSRAALTYQKAQEMIDDEKYQVCFLINFLKKYFLRML